MLQIKSLDEDVVHLKVAGMLTKGDYVSKIPQLEAAHDARGRLGYVIEMEDFYGWTPAALLEDLRFDCAYADQFGRIAVVGDERAVRLGSRLADLFFGAEFKAFASAELEAARGWVKEGS